MWRDFLATEKHTKAAYNFYYADMKALDYRSLVNQYYKKDTGTEEEPAQTGKGAE